ncbi:hypothetical protein CDL15_Pgr008488 [Punica granatum]|uniref:PCI domain-containing protein n=1 Tax=Punica granatum TaxID=22663 RepID=A0A218WNF8_PUNGR|nr:hypothetical protein CDL15_Pgr008488 [Punica granatum]
MSYGGFGTQSGPSVPPRNVNFGQFSRPPSSSPSQPLQTPPQAPPFPRPAPPFPRPVPVRSPLRPEGVDRGQSPLFSSGSNFSASRVPLSAPVAQSNFASHSRPPLSYEDIYESEEPYISPIEAQRAATISTTWSSQAKSPGNYAYSTAHKDPSLAPTYIRPYDSQRSPVNEPVDVGVPRNIKSPPLPMTIDISAQNSQFEKFEPKRTTPPPSSSITKREILFNRPQPSNRQTSSSPNMVPQAPATKSDGFLVPKRTRPLSPPSADQDFQNRLNASSSFLDRTAEAPATKSSSSPISKRTRSPSLLPSNQESQQQFHSSHDEIEREMQAKAKRLARFKVELIESPQSGSEFIDSKVASMRRDTSMVEGGNLSGKASMELSEDYPSSDPVQDYDGSEPSGIIIGLCRDMCPESERAERERKGDLDQYERVDGDRNQTAEFLAVKKYNRTAEREANLIRPMPVLQRTIEYLLSLLDQPYDDRFLGIYNFLWDRMRAVRMDLRMQHIFNIESVKMLEQMIRLHIIAMHELCEYEKGEGFSEGFDAHLNIEQMNKASAELFQLYDDHRRKGIDVPTEKEFRGYYALLKLDRHPGYKVEPAELSLDLAKMTPEIRQSSEIRFARAVARACRTGNFISFFRLARKASYLQACLMHAHFAKLRSQALASLHSGLQSNQGLPVSVVASWLAMEEEDIENVLEYHGFVIKEFKEQYMVKEGPFLHSDRDYPTKCSNLVHLKKSPRIVDDVLSYRSISSPSKKGTKAQLDRSFSIQKKTHLPAEKRSQMEEDEKSDDSKARQSPKQNNQEHLPFKLPAVSREKESSQTVASSANLSWNFPMTPPSPKVPPINFGETFKFGDNSRNSLNFPMTPSSPKAPSFNIVDNFSNNSRSSLDTSIPSAMEVTLPPVVPAMFPQDMSLGVSNGAFENSLVRSEAISGLENEEPLNEYPQEFEDDLDICQKNAAEEVLVEDEDKEVAEAKLKLILRSWKRRSSKRRELREQRQLVGADALNTLTLGPPIQRKKDHGGSFGIFDIDRITRARYGKHEQSWSRLNVADVAACTLTDRNPEAKCLCWKIILCSPMDGSDSEMRNQTCRGTHLTALDWLLAKLMPGKDEEDDELVHSNPGLSIWRKWVAPQSRSDLTCCLSVVKDITYSDNLNESVLGACAVLFLVCAGISLEHQKIRLQNLLNSLPPGSQLPLLILSDSFTKEAPSAIISNLGLHEVDPSRVGSCTVVFLNEDEQTNHLDGFYSDRRLREGLQWLAGKSPPQPVLLRVQMRGLVQSHLSSSLEILGRTGAAVEVNRYVSAFNEAVDQSFSKVISAANLNASGWPCPEIVLLNEFCDERRFAEQYLPTIKWSSDSKINPLLSALRDCKLPNFDDDISWLNRGCYIGGDIEMRRLLLEDFLIRYLTESTNIMGNPLARSEASLMVQRNVRLELRDSAYFIIPMWEPIFRRIFNWRLMSLSREDLSTCYILEQDAVPLQTLHVSEPINEEGMLLDHSFEYPSLDEMLQVGRSLSPLVEPDAQPKISEPINGSMSNGGVHRREDHTERDGDQLNREMASRGDTADYTISNASRSRGSIGFDSTEVSEQTENLSRLLQQCNIVQNVIDEKLSLYFC